METLIFLSVSFVLGWILLYFSVLFLEKKRQSRVSGKQNTEWRSLQSFVARFSSNESIDEQFVWDSGFIGVISEDRVPDLDEIFESLDRMKLKLKRMKVNEVNRK